eukprot:s2568_g8.t1
MGIGCLRAQFPTSSEAELLTIWLRQMAGDDVDPEILPRPLTLVSAVEEEQDKHVARVADYLRYISHDKQAAIHAKCYFQCAAGQREDLAWYSECTSLSPTILGQRGSLRNELYDNLDRSQTIDDPEEKPAGWHVAVDRGNDWYSPVYFESLWDISRSRRSNEANIRREVRLRIFSTSPTASSPTSPRLDADKKAQVLRVFDEWEQTSIAKPIDPHWDGEKFWDMVTNEAPLTDWLFKITDCLDQHFICRNPECTTVIHHCHWLRQISYDYRIDEQHAMVVNSDGFCHFPTSGGVIHGDDVEFWSKGSKSRPTSAQGQVDGQGAQGRVYFRGSEKTRATSVLPASGRHPLPAGAAAAAVAAMEAINGGEVGEEPGSAFHYSEVFV